MCPAHLQDRHFCSPIIDAESEATRLKEQRMAEEIEKVKKEYEEKQKRKKEREKQSSKDEKDKDKEKKNDKDDPKDKESTDSKTNDEKERDEKVSLGEIITLQDGPVVLNGLLSRSILSKRGTRRSQRTVLEFSHYTSMFTNASFPSLLLIYYRTFYQMRIDRLRGIEMAKRNQERMKSPSLFPSVPTKDL